MQAVVSACWRAEGPTVRFHVGDLAWWCYQHAGRQDEWRIGLWEGGDGEPAGWAWLDLPGQAELLVRPEHRAELIPVVVGWLLEKSASAGADELSVGVVDADHLTIDALGACGFRLNDEPGLDAMARPLEGDLPPSSVPDGYQLRHLRGAVDLANRVAVHRAAFSVRRPSRVSVQSYRTVMSAWPYRPELDWVVEAPNGRFVSSCLIWLDEENRVGELEPVGTDPAFWRMGLATAVCRAALHTLREHGADTAIVYSTEVPGMPSSPSLYRKLGFETHARHATLVRRTTGP
jgi:ribosomal protein S18 acetylase RimI-like enzyme